MHTCLYMHALELPPLLARWGHGIMVNGHRLQHLVAQCHGLAFVIAMSAMMPAPLHFRWSNRMAQNGLTKGHWRKHWQWFEIMRPHAQLVADDEVVRPLPAVQMWFVC